MKLQLLIRSHSADSRLRLIAKAGRPLHLEANASEARTTAYSYQNPCFTLDCEHTPEATPISMLSSHCLRK
jgi:hypothetical protein